MKALTVLQPYAWLIAAGHKIIENRNWAAKYRGPLLIHAGVKLHRTPIVEIERRFGISIPPDELQFGGVVARADLTDVVTSSDSVWFEGRYGFVLTNICPLPFKPCRGMPGFFDVDIG